MRNYKIAVVGTGYVGLSLGVLLSQYHQVVAVDIVQAKVDMINNKKSPIQDDYIEKYLVEKELKFCICQNIILFLSNLLFFNKSHRLSKNLIYFILVQ